jgi:DNA repair protein RadD
MKFEDRWYQTESKDSLLKDIKQYNPLIAVPTGAGKTIIMGRFISDFLKSHPTYNILIISNTKEILKQNYKTISNFFPEINIGLYSSGLKSKTINKITIAGIQSIYKKNKLFSHFDVCIIDECHTVPFEKKSMYRQFIDKVNIPKYVGMSATIFRQKIGYIHEGKNRVFNKLSYDLTSLDSFNKLIDDKYLCNLLSKNANLKLQTDDIKIVNGDYNQKELAKKNNRTEITKIAIKETLEIGKDKYKSWLIFAINIDHANNITTELKNQGINAIALHSKTKNNDDIIKLFKEGFYQALVSVGMITTGFDAPNIDLIVLLRPTKSPVLHVQMIGRGLRINKNKEHCLILDFSGNIQRLGPINNVIIPTTKKNKKKGEAPVKECPICHFLHPTMIKICPICNYKFKFKEKLNTTAASVDVIQKTKQIEQIRKWCKVLSVDYYWHKKKDKPNSIRVVYNIGLQTIQEFVCLDHEGYARMVAKNWTRARWWSPSPCPKTTLDLYKNLVKLATPKKILVNFTKKYPKIENISFE